MAQQPLFQPSPGDSIFVKPINSVNFGPAHLKQFTTPQVPGLETFPSNPAFSFVIEHPSVRKLVFDLSVEKDWHNYAPKIADHWYWDHIGDPSTPGPITDPIVGPGFQDTMLPVYLANPDSSIRETDYDFYLLNSPRHTIGYLCGLARTTTHLDMFVLVRSNIAHYAEIFRPSTYLLCRRQSPHISGRRTTDSLFEPPFGHDIPWAMEMIAKRGR
ncbi:hypothetical protein BDV27DRAFT_148676 [Aspergillus caelatus]|uniref:Uncharacterized protein n=1 Tax=Aspergillus caelatus TaxID=61420 RepID=A0A5N6ZT89_9EURO|nr:uncharacterized protein BDV27DRAFT_148676 [Aspergillus caelatus]KAE8360473.1 hypothetical protein BDV27DRAFT_148676 [Aspergillus caelatus]